MIHIKCPYCKGLVKIDKSEIDKTVYCDICGHRVVVLGMEVKRKNG